jgi:hypothetical protein
MADNTSETEKQYFTLVFEGDIQKFKGNPLTTDTVFGVPVAVGIGNAFDQIEELEADADYNKHSRVA